MGYAKLQLTERYSVDHKTGTNATESLHKSVEKHHLPPVRFRLPWTDERQPVKVSVSNEFMDSYVGTDSSTL